MSDEGHVIAETASETDLARISKILAHQQKIVSRLQLQPSKDSSQRLPTKTSPYLTVANTAKMSKATKKGDSGKAQGRSALEDVVAREYTIHLHKRVRSV